MRSDLPAGTVTFLFTDIEGSTRLLRELGTDPYAAALTEHRRALRAVFAAHGGVEVDTQGDAFFVAFATAPAAVAAALDGQEVLTSGPITVRMGLHTGSPTVTAEGYVGIDVHRGARVGALAHGGQIVISSTTAALVEDQPQRDLGRHRLKDFDAPVQLFQVGTVEFPPLRTPGAVDLPTPATAFLGRERELFEAATLWLDRIPRALTIIGPGGTGKTRFSIELARFLAEEADGGTVFVPLAPVRDPALVVPLIAAALGASGDSPTAIATRVGVRRTHVVLDNLEQLLPQAARPLAELLAAAPALRLITTSREPVRIAGESEYDLTPMREQDAVSLFLERAQTVRSDIADSPAVHELIKRLDGLPLAIELAAARVKLLGPEQLLERIAQRLDLLKGGRDVDERHATLRATIGWSYDLLTEEEQQLFARLAVFRGGCTLDVAEAVCEADLDTLASLLDKSLVRRRSDADGEERFWMLETIREFATELLHTSGEEDSLRRAQADQLIELADRAGTRAMINLPRPWNLDVVAPEMDNVRAVLEWAVKRDPERGLRLATWLEALWVVRDPVEGAAWLEALLAATPATDPELRGRAWRALGGALDIDGEHERAAPCYDTSLALFTTTGNEVEASHVRFRVAVSILFRGDADAAWPLFEASLTDSRQLGNRVGECQAIGFLAGKARRNGDKAGALEMALESAAIAREVGWTWWEAGQLLGAADLERDGGDFDAAETHALTALELGLSLGDRRTIVFSAAELAAVAAVSGDPSRAGLLWGAVEAEVNTGRVGQWEQNSAAIETVVLRADGPVFQQARAEGSLLSIPQAAGLEPS
ncbi:ATP-binding protein [Gaiella sp.]|uniref:ATP-binding protein n=1 Tax=Gaiella sp. TaxID=2663207 RepID=UPI003983B084